MSELRVLHLITTLDRGGAENALLHLTRQMRAAGADVLGGRAVRPAVGYLKGAGELAPEFEAADIPVQRLELSGLRGIGAFARGRDLLRTHRPHVVHTHLFKADALGAALLRTARPGAPVLVSTKHNEDAYLDGTGPVALTVRGFADRTARRADAVIAISDGVARHVRTRLPAAAERLHVIRYGVPEPPPADGPRMRRLRETWGLPRGVTVLLCPARFVEQKDHATLFEALRRRRSQAPVRLVLLGRGPLEETLRAQAADLGEQVLFAGFLDDPDPAFGLCDAVVLASSWEGLGLALVEGAFRGRPAVATAVGGVPEVVQDGSTGLLVPPGDPDLLARALDRLTDDRGLASTLGRAARTFVRERFDLAARTADVLRLYERLLA